MIKQLGLQVASEGRQRAEERRGRTEAERRLRAEKQVSMYVPLHAAVLGGSQHPRNSSLGAQSVNGSPCCRAQNYKVEAWLRSLNFL